MLRSLTLFERHKIEKPSRRNIRVTVFLLKLHFIAPPNILVPKQARGPIAITRLVDFITIKSCLKPKFKVYNVDKQKIKEATS